ncbi:MAG TPA: Mut7-C RNAse domain-containing protein [Smithellaceae bacterium]|nr:Mut7-C RNAse domain-containing protein [Smithellaceae bacterium]
MNAAPAFLVDASLAGLGRWLRLLGFDTLVYTGEAGRPMMKMALEDHRILLTRRFDMRARQFSGRLVLVPEASVGFQLRFVLDKLGLAVRRNQMYRLCVLCNAPVRPIPVEEARDRVPTYVFQHCRLFHICDQCGKIYWRGTHPRNAERFLRDNGIPLDD